MTRLLERALAEAARLPDDAQDALAARILDEIDDEQGWNRSFAATTDAQWDRLAALARTGIAADGSTPLHDLTDGPQSD